MYVYFRITAGHMNSTNNDQDISTSLSGAYESSLTVPVLNVKTFDHFKFHLAESSVGTHPPSKIQHIAILKYQKSISKVLVLKCDQQFSLNSE